MISELEQEFYDTFGIKPKIGYDYKTIIQDVTKTGYWFDKEYLIKIFNDNQKFKVIQVRKNINYPDITAEKLLEMICIINEFISMFNWKQIKYISTFEFETLKENILKDLIWILNNECNDITAKQLKHQIQQLFKD